MNVISSLRNFSGTLPGPAPPTLPATPTNPGQDTTAWPGSSSSHPHPVTPKPAGRCAIGTAPSSAPPASTPPRPRRSTLVPNSSGGVDEVEAGEVAGAGAVQGVAVPPGIQADQVEGDCGEHVLEVGLGQPAVAGVADAGDRDGLADGALDPGAEGVARLPGSGALRGAGGLEGVMEAAGADGELPPATLGGGAPGADRARPADRGGELHHDRVGAPLGAGTPPGAQ